MKRFIITVLALLITCNVWAVSSNTGGYNDMGLIDPRIYGGAADTMKQTLVATTAVSLTVTAGYVEATCSDATSGCLITMTETGAVEGDRVQIVNVGASNSMHIADQAGIVNLEATLDSMAIGPEDSLSLTYTGTIWVETSRSNN